MMSSLLVVFSINMHALLLLTQLLDRRLRICPLVILGLQVTTLFSAFSPCLTLLLFLVRLVDLHDGTLIGSPTFQTRAKNS